MNCAVVVSGNNVLIGFLNGELTLLSLNDGALRWNRKLPAIPLQCARLDELYALVCTREGQLFCINLQTGEDRWVHRTRGAIYSIPLVEGDEIFFGSNDHHFYVVDRETGETRFKLQTDGRVTTDPASYHNLILFGSDDYNVYCFDKIKREIVWTYTTKFLVRSSPTIFESMNWYHDSVCTASWMDMVCLNVETGEVRWIHPTAGEIWCKPLLFAEYLIFSTCGPENLVYCLNNGLGSINWFKRYGYDPVGQPVLYSDNAFLVSHDSSIRALDIHEGTELWHLDQIDTSVIPIVSENHLIVAAYGEVRCYDLSTVV